MKKLILTVLLTLIMSSSTTFAGWFDNDEEKQRLQQTEQQLAQERESKGGWEIIAGVLAVGAITLFVVGTALGSKVRKEVRDDS